MNYMWWCFSLQESNMCASCDRLCFSKLVTQYPSSYMIIYNVTITVFFFFFFFSKKRGLCFFPWIWWTCYFLITKTMLWKHYITYKFKAESACISALFTGTLSFGAPGRHLRSLINYLEVTVLSESKTT